MTRVLFAAAVALSLVGAASAQPICDLTLNERFNVARSNEPVRMGVPLPRGLVKDVGDLALTDAAGKPVPVQADEAMKWDDGSVRWVHLSFCADVPAGGKAVVKLVRGKPARSQTPIGPATKWDSVQGVGRIDVELEATIDGKKYSTDNARGGKSKAVVQGPECSVMQATGKLTTKSGEEGLTYTIYQTRTAGSPDVQLSISYTNELGQQPTDFVKVEDLALVIKTPLKEAKFTIGGEKEARSGQLAAGESAAVLATGSKSVVIRKGDQELETFNPIASKPLTVGWASLQNDKAGLAVGCRWFWQMWPKDVTVSGDGAIRVGLYSSAASDGKALDCYMGQGRTHYITLHPFAPADAGKVPAAMAALQVPLRAVASPEYYCRVAGAFGKMADADPAIYPADLRAAEKSYDATLRKSLDYIIKKKDGHAYNGVTRDSYGYMAWGDVFHYANDKNVEDPWNILWESNYYDFPWACILQFARTGDETFLDIGDSHGLHIADVFMCKWHPQAKLRGACRYSPPANHVGLDTSWKSPKPYVSVEFNHHKAQSILARYLLLADLRAKDDFLLALNNATLNPEGSWGQCRGPGAKLATLYEGWLLTGQQPVMDMMKRTVAAGVKNRTDPKKFSKQGKSGYFMMGIAAEGLLYYNWLTGDNESADTVRAICDYLMDGRGLQGPQLAYPLAFTWRRTGEDRYRDEAVKLLSKTGMENRPKGFGMSWRSTPYAWYYLSTLAEGEKK